MNETVLLKTKYLKEIKPALLKKYNLKNGFQVPGIEKVVVNMGVGYAVQNPKVLDHLSADLALLTGQRPSQRVSKKAIAAFKLRKGLVVGLTVTLRSDRMYQFLERFFNVALPRVKDFRGISKKFDGRGNFSCGIKEYTIFPEVDNNRTDYVTGMNISIVTTAQNDLMAYDLLKSLGCPFRE